MRKSLCKSQHIPSFFTWEWGMDLHAKNTHKYQNIKISINLPHRQLSYETCTMDRYVLVPSKLMIPSPWDQDGKAPGYRERNGKGLDSSAVEFLICDWWNVAQSRAVLTILFVQYMFRCYYSSVLFHLRMIRKLPILLQG